MAALTDFSLFTASFAKRFFTDGSKVIAEKCEKQSDNDVKFNSVVPLDEEISNNFCSNEGVQFTPTKPNHDYAPSAPPLDSSIELSPSYTTNWTTPVNTDVSRKTNFYSANTSLDTTSKGISQSPLRTCAGLEANSSPVPVCRRLSALYPSEKGAWCAAISYEACVRLCLHAWNKSYCPEVHCFLENECALLRNAFGLQNVLLQSEAEILAKGSSEISSVSAAPKPIKTSARIKLQVCKVKRGLDKPPASCSSSSLGSPKINNGSIGRHASTLKSSLYPWLKSVWKNYLPHHGRPESDSFWRSWDYIRARAKCIKQVPGILKSATSSLWSPSSSYELSQGTYSCFLRLRSSPEEDGVRMQPGSSETHLFFPDSLCDDLIISIRDSKGQNCGYARVEVAAVADKPGDKLRWWPIYSDLELEPVGRIHLYMEYSTSPEEKNHIKFGSITEAAAYDYVFEVAMKVQDFQLRNFLIHDPWRWLLIEFASYFGVSEVYTKLRHLAFIMDIATPTEHCLTIVHDLLSDLCMLQDKRKKQFTHQENRMLVKIKDQVNQTLALVFENYKSLEESSPSGMMDVSKPASGLAAPALAPAFHLYSLLHDDLLSSEAQIKICRFFHVAAKKRLRMHLVETDLLIQSSNDRTERDPVTCYQKMKSLVLSIRNEILTDINIQNQHILPWYTFVFSINLPSISSAIYSVELCSRLHAFLVACPPPGLSPPVAELILTITEFERDLSLWNINPVVGGVDTKELFHSHITTWIRNKRRNLLEWCKLDKATRSGIRTKNGTTPFIDDIYNQLMETLYEYEIISSCLPMYTSILEKAIADAETAVCKGLEKHYADVLSPLKNKLTNKVLGHKYVQKLSNQTIDIYSVPDEVGMFLNSLKWMLDVMWPNIETKFKSWKPCIANDGYATGEHFTNVFVILRTKYRNYRRAIVEKLTENFRVQNATKLKNILRDSKEVESTVRSRMQPLEGLLRNTIDNLNAVADATVSVELWHEFWDRMGQDVLRLLDNKRSRSWCKGLQVAVSILNDVFGSEMQRLCRNSSRDEKFLAPPESIKEVQSILCKDVI